MQISSLIYRFGNQLITVYLFLYNQNIFSFVQEKQTLKLYVGLRISEKKLINSISVLLPRRINAGINPLKNPLGPTVIISLKQSIMELYVPSGAFIMRVFITSSGIVNKVAAPPGIIN